MSKEAPKELVDWLIRQMDERNWSVRETARHAEISHTPISYVISGGEQPSFQTCVALASAFDVPPVYVLQLAGLLSKPPDHTPIVEELVGLFAQLSKDDQEEIVQLTRFKLERKRREGQRGAAVIGR